MVCMGCPIYFTKLSKSKGGYGRRSAPQSVLIFISGQESHWAAERVQFIRVHLSSSAARAPGDRSPLGQKHINAGITAGDVMQMR